MHLLFVSSPPKKKERENRFTNCLFIPCECMCECVCVCA